MKMIEHLAKKVEIELLDNTHISEPQKINDNKKNQKGSQEFHILNERIEIMMDQFTKLKNNIKLIAQATSKSNNNNQETMETDNEYSIQI